MPAAPSHQSGNASSRRITTAAIPLPPPELVDKSNCTNWCGAHYQNQERVRGMMRMKQEAPRAQSRQKKAVRPTTRTNAQVGQRVCPQKKAVQNPNTWGTKFIRHRPSQIPEATERISAATGNKRFSPSSVGPTTRKPKLREKRRKRAASVITPMYTRDSDAGDRLTEPSGTGHLRPVARNRR